MENSLRKENVLFFTRAMGIGGTENVILQMCDVLGPKVNKIIVCSCGGESVEKLEKRKIKHYFIPDIAQKKISVAWNVLKTLNSIVENENISVIHVHDRMAAFYVSICNIKNVKYFATFHLNFKNKKSATKFAYKKAKVIACGKNVEKTLVEYYGLQRSQISIIRNTIAPSIREKGFDKTIKAMKENGNFVVGYIGRLSSGKGQDNFIDSFLVAKQKIPNLKYAIVGDGEQKEMLQKEVDDYKIKDDVLFMGYRDDASELMEQFDAVVLTSESEGFPLVPIEAFSKKKIFIGSDVEGINEIVTHNVTGLLVPAKNPRALADAICTVLSDKNFREKIEESAYNEYRKNYSFEKFSDQIISFYEKYTGGNG